MSRVTWAGERLPVGDVCSSPTKRPSRDPSLGPASMEQARAEPQGPAQERKLHLLWRAWCPGGCLTGARPWPQEGMLAGVSRLGRPPGPEGTRGAAPAGWPWASSGQLRVPQESMGPLSYLLSSQARKLGQVQRRGHSGGESGGEGAAPGEGCVLQNPSLQGAALPRAPASGPEPLSWVWPPQPRVTHRTPFLTIPHAKPFSRLRQHRARVIIIFVCSLWGRLGVARHPQRGLFQHA